MSGTSKAPLGDITHRPLTGRRSGNTTAQQVANLTCSAGQGDENNPTRGLLDLFTAQSGSVSLNRKRSLKRFTDDSEHPIARFLSPQPSPTKPSATKSNAAKAGGVSPTKPAATTVIVVDPILSGELMPPTGPLFLHTAKAARPTSILSTISRRQTFGRQRNVPYYVSTREYMLDYISRPSDVYSFVSQDGATLVPPFSCAYNNVSNGARNLAVGDEDGTIHIVDTRRERSHPDDTKQILAHQNAIFDLCWTRDDSKIVSVSGDQSARIHDVETKKCIGVFSGHTGSIKSVSMKHNDDFIFATAARDGAVMVWDSRCSSTTSATGDTIYRPADRLLNVHASTTRAAPPKKSKHGSDGPNTASAVQYMLHNEHIIASTGSLDGSIKYWDVRKHGTYFKHDYPTPLQTSKYTPTTKRAHGMTSMALSPDGRALYALSSDNNIYMYNTTALGHPVERFGGSGFACSSYYIKISVSPDGNYIAAGSSKDLYVWEINMPQRKPLVFQGHEREVTGVDWAKDLGHGTELSGCSDDAKVRTWKPNGELVQECRENKSLQNLHGIVSE
ncbi:MAG: WD40-repeat-containing domain protein [Linnemannia elongata]|nr:MAG: WD40-repeat-containing domain protein [Linnemannia elongata]